MAEEKKKFVLYEYLLYFSRKKKYFVLIPLLTTLLIAGLVYALKGNDGYTGKALVYTGSIDLGEYTHPNNLEADFDKVNPDTSVFVSGKNQIKISLEGDSKSKVEKDLDEIVSEYHEKLLDQYNSQLDASWPYVHQLEESYQAKEILVKQQYKKLDESSLTPSQLADIQDLILELEEDIAEEKKDAHSMRGKISLFEKPRILSKEIAEKDSFLKESIIAGLLLGFVLAFAFLILLKYIEEARRYYKR